MLNHKEVLEALLAGKVLRDIVDKDIIIFMGADGKLYSEIGKPLSALYLPLWELAPETIEINGIEVPKPETTAPPYGTTAYIPLLYGSTEVHIIDWNNSRLHHEALTKGLIHLSKENAIAHAKALLSFTSSEL